MRARKLQIIGYMRRHATANNQINGGPALSINPRTSIINFYNLLI